MHAIQTLAHRAPPATRTRVRWQPYNSTPSAARNILLHTPLHVSPISVTPANDLFRPTPSIKIAQASAEPMSKDPASLKASFGIVDQAVKSLCEIWRPQDIPSPFLPPRGLGTVNDESKSISNQALSTSPFLNSHLSRTQLCLDSTNTASASHDPTNSNASLDLAPMKCFVHEVLRRSRTSGCVLQTALCYLEAIRCKVPQLLQAERAGIRPDTSIPRIILTKELKDDIDLQSESICSNDELAIDAESCIINTVKILDHPLDPILSASEPILASAVNADLNTTSLPSPLLCPRRAFLASLILASKFTQDKCYSNRAWAKLSGLPPKEISRCERALGEALDWRLWVGKQSMLANSVGQRTLGRSQSESCLSILQPVSLPQPEDVIKSVSNATQGGLRRCATLPVETYALQMPRLLTELPATQIVTVVHDHDTEMLGSDVPIEAPDVLTSPRIIPTCTSSPSPSTPGLAYSPSSESSAGDQTVQMSTYFDEPAQTPAGKVRAWEQLGGMVLLDNIQASESCAKSAMTLTSFLTPSGNLNSDNPLESAWYIDSSMSAYMMPTFHAVECS